MLLVGLFFWYRRQHRRPGVLPQEVLDAEFGSNDVTGGGEVDYSSHLTPFFRNAATHYLASSIVPFAPAVGGSHSPDCPNSSNEKLRSAGVVSQEAVVPVPNLITPEEDIQNARMQVEGRVQDFGPIDHVSENQGGVLPPDYQQATEPFHTGHV